MLCVGLSKNLIKSQSKTNMIEEVRPAIDSKEMWSPVETRGACGPCARAKHSATLLAGHVLVLAGRGAGNLPLRDFWRYTIATGVWEKLSSRGEPPPYLQEHSATAHGARLYVFGGEATALLSETPLWIYDTETEFWRKLPGQASCTGTIKRRGARAGGRTGAPTAGAGPSGRRGHSAHALKDCLLIYGGYKDLRGSTNELWAFHYESESWQGVRTLNAGPARHRHASALHDARLYVHAGQCDLRLCSDLWLYDTISRLWSQVRTPAKLSPAARSGHAAARAGGHLYIFGGDAGGQPDNDMWRFHFATETWERVVPCMRWPSARVDACAMLVAGAAWGVPAGSARGQSAAPAPPRPPPTLLSRLSSLQVRRAPRAGTAYSVLGERDSTESLRDSPAINKSRSAHLLAARRPAAPGDESIPHEPISVPEFADMVLPPAQAAKLVYLDSDSEEERRDRGGTTHVLPKSASVRFTRDLTTDSEEGEFSTSDYASAERVNGLSTAGFSNPHYLGPDVRALGAALTPDSGLGPGDIELQDMRPRRLPPRTPPAPPEALHLLLVGGREPVARLRGPLSMWTYRLL